MDSYSKREAFLLLGRGQTVKAGELLLRMNDEGEIVAQFGKVDWNVCCGPFTVHVEPLADEEIAYEFECRARDSRNSHDVRLAWAGAARIVRERKLL